MEINWSLISTIASTITAIIAIVAPVITSIFTAKSQERMKKMELFSPLIYDAVAELVKTYAELRQFVPPTEDSDAQYAFIEAATGRCNKFRAACFKVMSLVPTPQVQEHITNLLAEIGNTVLSPDSRHDQIFYQLIADVNAYHLGPKARKVKNKIRKAKH